MTGGRSTIPIVVRNAVFVRRLGFRPLSQPWNFLAGQALDRADGFTVCWRNDGDCGAAPSRAPCAAYTVNVVVRMMRHVEVEDMAHFRNIQPAGSNIGSDEQLGLSFAKAIERRHSRGLIHIAMESDSIKFVPQ